MFTITHSLQPLFTTSKWLLNVWINLAEQTASRRLHQTKVPFASLFVTFEKTFANHLKVNFQVALQGRANKRPLICVCVCVWFTWQSGCCSLPGYILSGLRRVLPAPTPGRISRTLNLLRARKTKMETHWAYSGGGLIHCSMCVLPCTSNKRGWWGEKSVTPIFFKLLINSN